MPATANVPQGATHVVWGGNETQPVFYQQKKKEVLYFNITFGWQKSSYTPKELKKNPRFKHLPL